MARSAREGSKSAGPGAARKRTRSRRKGPGDSRDPGASELIQRLYGIHAVHEALRAARRPLHRLWVRDNEGRRPVAGSIRKLVAAAESAGIPVEAAGPDFFEALASDPAGSDAPGNPQGVALDVGPIPEAGLEQACAGLGQSACLVALDGVEDPQNVGAIVRVAEAAGCGGLLLSRRRAPPLSPAVARASSGALEWLPIVRVSNLTRAIKVLKRKDFWVAGADPASSGSVFDPQQRWAEGRVLLVLGAEGRGLRPAVRAELDFPLHIPMRGKVASLNVATAAAVVLFEWARRSESLAQTKGIR